MNTLFLGTIPPPISGQALAYYYSYAGFKGKKNLINKNQGVDKNKYTRVFFLFLFYCTICLLLFIQKD
jgi:hypothetical protein